MSALTFDKNELGNLEYSLQREVLSTDRRGGYMSTTIVCCNTRRYHGLMVAPIGRGDQTCVLLSSLDETIVQHDQSFNLAIHRFRGVYEPRGHKYITDFAYTPTPTITYRVGGVILRKELLWIHKRTQLMIRYTLLDSPADIRLRLRPFFAYREKEALTHANMEANGRSYPVQGGVKNRLYEGYPWLYLQTNRPDAEFVAAPDWYYGFEYPQELARGYDGYEDLLTTGYFELPLSKGQSVIFSASVEEMASSAEIGALFDRALARRTHKIDFHSLLRHSARQFVIRRPDGRTEVMACPAIRGSRRRSPAKPSCRCRASRSNRITRRTASTCWTACAARSATAISPVRHRPRRKPTPRCGSSTHCRNWNPRSAAARSGAATAKR